MPCHDAATRTSGLSLASYAGVMRGGKGGPVIAARKSAESRLIGMVEGRLALRMPPGGPSLPAAEIAILRAWIDAGAKGDAAPAAPSPPAGLPAIHPDAPVSGAASALAFSPDGQWLAIGGYRQIWLARPIGPAGPARHGGALPALISLSPPGARPAGPVTALAFSPDGSKLAAAGGSPGQFGEIQIWDVHTRTRVPGRLIRTLRGLRDAIYSVAYSPDGRRLAGASYDRLVSLWPVTGEAPRLLKDHIDAVYGVAFSPDGRHVASCSGDRTIKVWDTISGRRLFTLSEPTAEQYTVAFSRDGQLLAAGGADRIVRLWHVTPSGARLVRSAFAHEGAVLRVLFSPDGRSLFTTGEDRQVKEWDVATLTERRLLPRQPDWAPALALSPDGRRLAVGRFDGSVALYDPHSGRLEMPLLRLPPPAPRVAARNGSYATAERQR